MERKLPQVDIIGTAFIVDVLHDELRQKDNIKNAISFNVFDQDRDGYTFLYDKVTKTAPADKSMIDPKEMGTRYEWVTLPALMELDPQGIALKYHIPLEVLCPELATELEDEDDDETYEDTIYR